MAKFRRGTDVGIFAQSLFPGGIDCKPKSPSQYRKSVEKTAAVIAEKNHDVIYEATFQYDRVLILLDILAKENGKWNAYEVKSSLKISETYLLDAVLQYYVLRNSGIEIDKFFLVHLNPDYVFDEKLEIDQLFTFVDVTAEIQEKQTFIQEQIAVEKEAIALKKSPPIEIGVQCNNPYPCDFIGLCWKKVPEKSVFDLVFLSENEKFERYHAGQKTIGVLNAENFTDENLKKEIISRQQDKAFFDRRKFAAAMNGLNESVSFLGFLGNRVAIPQWKSYKPFDFVPIAVTVLDSKNNAGQHYFNASPESNPDKEFIAFLKSTLETAGNIVVFDKGRFALQLDQLIFRNPQHKESLRRLQHKIFDLKTLILDFTYFNPQFSKELEHLDLYKILPNGDNPKPEYHSDALAINAYLKQPVSEMTTREMTELTTWRAEMVNGFFHHLNSR